VLNPKNKNNMKVKFTLDDQTETLEYKGSASKANMYDLRTMIKWMGKMPLEEFMDRFDYEGLCDLPKFWEWSQSGAKWEVEPVGTSC